MSEPRAIEPNEPFFRAAIQGGPYVVIADENVCAFRSYAEAEAFARSQESMNPASVTLARVIFRPDGTPDRLNAFPTTYADCSFERARREFGL
jgi:hypothetical protein